MKVERIFNGGNMSKIGSYQPHSAYFKMFPCVWSDISNQVQRNHILLTVTTVHSISLLLVKFEVNLTLETDVIACLISMFLDKISDFLGGENVQYWRKSFWFSIENQTLCRAQTYF